MKKNAVNESNKYQKREEDIDNHILSIEQMFQNPDPHPLVVSFQKEIRDCGFDFEYFEQVNFFLPKQKDIILPIIIRYYQEAKRLQLNDLQLHFLSLLTHKGLDEVVPMLLDDFLSFHTDNLTRWFISSCLYQIRAKSFVDEYINIIANSAYGKNRQMLILLVGKLKVERAIPILIDLLEDEDVRLQAICALGDYKREELRVYFERFASVKHPGWRKYANAALKKLH